MYFCALRKPGKKIGLRSVGERRPFGIVSPPFGREGGVGGDMEENAPFRVGFQPDQKKLKKLVRAGRDAGAGVAFAALGLPLNC